MKQLTLDIAAPALPTLDNFIAGRNAELVERLRQIAAGGGGERFVYLWGEAGCGRSHLLRAVVAGMRATGLAAFYTRCGDEPPDPAARADGVALDDVERMDEGAQGAAFGLYNALRERRGSLIAAGTAPPAQLALRPDLVTRLAWGLVYQVSVLTDEEKAEAIEQRARARGFSLPAEVRDFMLARAPRDIVSLLGLVDALDRRSLEIKRPVTVPMARALLGAGEVPGAVRHEARTEGAD